jgi:hypothetical protein
MSRPALVALGGVCALAACSSDAPVTARGAAPPPEPAASEPSKPSSPQAAPPATPGDVSGKNRGEDVKRTLYDAATIPKFELTLDAAAIAVLSSKNAADEKTWVHAGFKFGAVTFADVGVRRKGTSTLRALPEKTSLKVKLDKWVKGQTLDGLEELTLDNMVYDPTFLAERLAYHVFRSMGLPAPLANTAELSINGEPYGIFANIETVNRSFLERVLGKKAKTLYEVSSWGGSWLPGDEAGFEIKVADPSAPAGSKPDLERLFKDVAAAHDETLLADLAAHLDTKQWLRHSATEAATGYDDGYAYGRWGSANYFMAGDADGKFSLVPWSTDLTFSDREGVSDAANPLNPTVLARCKTAEPCWSAYKAEVQSVLAVYETLDLVNLAKKWHDQIEPLVQRDPTRTETVDSHLEQTALLYDWLAARPRVVRTQLGL